MFKRQQWLQVNSKAIIKSQKLWVTVMCYVVQEMLVQTSLKVYYVPCEPKGQAY